jgi:hypothetical protein
MFGHCPNGQFEVFTVWEDCEIPDASLNCPVRLACLLDDYRVFSYHIKGRKIAEMIA